MAHGSIEMDATAAEESGGQSGSATTGLKLVVTIMGLCFSVFCVALDNTIIATAIPRITDEFHALQDVGWYGSGMIANTRKLPLNTQN